MPLSPAHVRDLVAAYRVLHPREPDGRDDIDGLADLVAGLGARAPVRLTVTAVVVDRDRRVLHLHRDDSGSPLLPSGRVTAEDTSLMAAALRSLYEDAGIPPGALTHTPAYRDRPIDIAATGTEDDQTPYQGYDFRFVLYLADGHPADDGLTWLPFDEVGPAGLRAKLLGAGLDGTVVPVNASAVIHDGHGSYLLHLRDAAEHPSSADDLREGIRAGAPSGSGAALHVVGVHLYLERDGMVLLGLRHPDSAFAGETWHALAGHCEAESATACLVREAYEEAGLVIDPEGVELVHTVHVVDRPGGRPRIQLFFRARRWEGTPELREPDKCVAWQWWSPKDLPEPIVPYTRAAIEGITAGRPYTEWGWAG